MNDKVKIYTGMAVFLGIVLFPVWYNLASGGTTYRAEIVVKTANLPGRDKCVMPVEYMRTSHMTLLKDWREAVVRTGNRSFTNSNGLKFQRSLTGTCLDCHSNKQSFCDRCHDYAALQPNCWNCHVAPPEEIR
jgi:hypothetical protein